MGVRERILMASAQILAAPILKDETVGELAKKYAKMPSQILLKWAHSNAVVALCDERKKQKMADNAQIFAFEMDYNDLSRINALTRPQTQTQTESADADTETETERVQWTPDLERDFKER